MPVAVTYNRINGDLFEYPFRMIISGSSQCGKTTFAERLLKENIFKQEPKLILYCHPDLLEGEPVNWEETLDIPISYKKGLPTLKELSELQHDTCVVLDDLYEECITSRAVDQLFRVISGKKNISVIAMTQRYFAQGRFGMNIRNNCNYTVLMRNADERINKKLGNLFNCKENMTIALKEFQNQEFPYIMISSTRNSLVTGCRIYTKIFGRSKYVIMNSTMIALLPKDDFKKHFKIIGKNQAMSKSKKAKWDDEMDESDINFTDCSDDEPPKKKARAKPKKKAKIHWSERRWMDVSSDDNSTLEVKNPKLMTAEDYAEKYDTDVESESESAPESKSDSERTESESESESESKSESERTESESESEPENIKSQTEKSSQTYPCKNNNTLGYARRMV